MEKKTICIEKKLLTKWIISLSIIFLSLLSLTSVLDNQGNDYFDKALGQATITFAVSKGLNAVISTIQDTDISIAPWGLGMSLGLGEVLDPVNDLIERFSNVMFSSLVSLGIQKILAEIGRSYFVKIILLGTAILIMLALFLEKWKKQEETLEITIKIAVVCLVARFAMPVVALVNNQIYDSLMIDKITENTNTLSILSDEIGDMKLATTTDVKHGEIVKETETVSEETSTPPLSQNEDAGWLGKLGKAMDGAKVAVRDSYETTTEAVGDSLSKVKHTFDMDLIEAKMDEIKLKVSETSTYLINLSIIFIFQTIISPLLVLWGLLKLTGILLSSDYEKKLTAKLMTLK